MDAAKRGIVTPEIETVAKKENRPVEFIMERVAKGTIAIPANINHKSLSAEAVGDGTRVKINVNLGISGDCKDYEMELRKVRMAVDMGAESIMDLSNYGKTNTFRKQLIDMSPAMIGTVPMYDAIGYLEKDLLEITAQDFLKVVEAHAREGVDFMTIHAGINRRAVEAFMREGRRMNIVSRGGSLLFAWMKMTGNENPFFEYYDEVLDILRRYDVTISLGDALRPGCIDDASDAGQISELIELGNLAQRAWAKDVQVMIEGPGHMAMNEIAANMQDNKEDNKSFSATGFLSDKLTNLDFAMQYREGAKPRGSVSQDRLIGFFANASYAYDNRYLFDFSYRTDGSSKFGKKNRFAPFWSAGIGWNIHNEKFWGNPEWLTQAKIRSSVGYTGNVTFSPYQAQTTYQYSSDNIYLNGVGADIIALGNEDLKWQRKFTVNLGCDLDFWEGRFSLTGEYFREYTKDVLMDISLPPSLGFIDYKENFGEMENKGWSLNLRTQMLRDTERELYWSLAFGTSDSKNKIKKITDKLGAMNDENNKNETKKPVPLYEEGESLDALKAVPSLGIDPETGKEVFVKKDGSLTTIWDYNDKVVCGTTDPKFRGTLNSFLTFKGISLNMSFNFQWGGQTYNQTLASRVEGVNPNSNCDRRVLYDRWKKPGDRTFFKNIALEENVSNLTTRFVQDYNYFQIGSISLGYEMRRELCRKIGLTGLRFNFNMGDIARFSSVKEERGLSYPFARQFTFSLSASL